MSLLFCLSKCNVVKVTESSFDDGHDQHVAGLIHSEPGMRRWQGEYQALGRV